MKQALVTAILTREDGKYTLCISTDPQDLYLAASYKDFDTAREIANLIGETLTKGEANTDEKSRELHQKIQEAPGYSEPAPLSVHEASLVRGIVSNRFVLAKLQEITKILEEGLG